MGQRNIDLAPGDRVTTLIEAHATAARRSASTWTRRGRRRYLSLVGPPRGPLTRRKGG
jgi:hypothetical protein